MALSTRDLYLVLRARDEASRVVRGLSSELLRAGAVARAAAARSQAAAFRQAAVVARQQGATANQIRALQASAAAWDHEADRIMRAAAARQRFGNIMQNTSQALITSGVAMAAVGAVTLTWLYRTIDAAQEYERQVRLTTTQTDDFAGSLQKVHDIGLRVARTVGVAFEEIQPALYDILSSTDVSVEQAGQMLEQFAKAAVAGQVDIQAASRATIAIMNGFNLPLERVNDVLDVQFQLVRYGVGTYEEFAGVIGNVIPSATRAGQSIETVAAMLAFLTRNGLSASMAATSAARALEAMSHPKTINRMEEMGIKVRDAAGNMRPLTDILTQLRAKIEQLPPAQRVEALVDLLRSAGGTIQARRFLEQVLLRPGELEQLIGFLDAMENSTGAFEKAYGGMADSIAVKTQLLKNQWQALKVGIGEAVIPEFVRLMTFLSKLLEKFNELPKGTKDAISQFLVWGSVVGIVGGAIVVLLGIFAALVAAFVAGGAALGVFILAAGMAAGYIGAFATMVIGMWTNSEKLRSGVMALIGAFRQLYATAVETLGPMAEQVRSAFADKIIQGLKIAGDIFAQIFTLVAAMITNWVIPALQSLKKMWDENQATIRPFINVLAEVAKWVGVAAALILGLLVGSALTGLVAGILFAINAVKLIIAVISLWIGWIKNCVAAIQMFIGWLGQAASWIVNLGSTAHREINRIPTIIRNAFANAGSWLVEAGRQIIQGLVNGINAAIGAVRNALANVTSLIPDWKGPKEKDLKLLKPTGKMLMQGLATGIWNSRGLVKDALGSVTGTMTQIGGVDRLRSTASGVTHSKTVNQTVNVTTQEIDPRYHAAQLGWELLAVAP